MALFEPITVEWKGESRDIPESGVMRTLARIEETLTFAESLDLLNRFFEAGDRKQMRVADAYAQLLKAAGFRQSPEDVLQVLDGTNYGLFLVALYTVLKFTLSPAEREKFDKAVNGELDKQKQGEPAPEGEAPAAEPL